ncbi:hypothetical protein B9Z47_09570 [Limnohabitans sp. 2KL-1]|uniref:hypothetical protein n=1 Tax=Limnohabitans sp. 2KL-1 TaxID=1100699 RepID=UPI000D340195|nr:hypothetical protein [Limnohabitans sp. 2KL-1]PUE48072.1 hypothetical protein B9Z47_09570 [Limnohabitans sp. 2KL-1]
MKTGPQRGHGTPEAHHKPGGAQGVQVFQIYFKNDQLQKLDPSFIAYDNRQVDDERLEFGVFERLAQRADVKQLQAWGAVSWRFNQKTGLTGQQWLDAVTAEPGVDLFYTNVAPLSEGLYDNGWMQGEISHPGLMSVAAAVLKASGYDSGHLFQPEASHQYSTANYFVGSQKFWQLYLPFVKSTLQVAEPRVQPSIKRQLHNSADPTGLHHRATYVPFIVERLLPLFLATVGRHLRTRQVRLPAREAELNEHIRVLAQLKDKAILEQSTLLLTAWRNYRNLYLQQVARPDWCKQHLPWMNGPRWQTSF